MLLRGASVFDPGLFGYQSFSSGKMCKDLDETPLQTNDSPGPAELTGMLLVSRNFFPDTKTDNVRVYEMELLSEGYNGDCVFKPVAYFSRSSGIGVKEMKRLLVFGRGASHTMDNLCYQYSPAYSSRKYLLFIFTGLNLSDDDGNKACPPPSNALLVKEYDRTWRQPPSTNSALCGMLWLAGRWRVKTPCSLT